MAADALAPFATSLATAPFADPGYLGPQSYTLTWPLLGGFLLLGLLIWSVVIWLLTRRPDDRFDAPLPPQAVMRLRAAALTRIDEVEQQVTDGELAAREGHHELSTTVRDYVSEVSGLPAETMTAADLRRAGPPHLAELIESYYPRQFGARESEPPSIRSSATAARDVVRGW